MPNVGNRKKKEAYFHVKKKKASRKRHISVENAFQTSENGFWKHRFTAAIVLGGTGLCDAKATALLFPDAQLSTILVMTCHVPQ